MNFDWNEYLLLAQDLCNKKPPSAAYSNEAKYRCAISRAYYSAFCVAKNYLLNSGQDFQECSETSKIHHEVKMAFKSIRNNQICVQIGENLERLRKNRNKADYDNIYNGRQSVIQNDALISLGYSANVISNIKKLEEMKKNEAEKKKKVGNR